MNGEEKIITLEKIQENAYRKHNIKEILENLKTEVTPDDYNDVYDKLESQIRLFLHHYNERYEKYLEHLEEHKKEIDHFHKLAPHVYSKMKAHCESMEQMVIDATEYIEITTALLYARNIMFCNAYSHEHNIPRGLEEAEEQAIRKNMAYMVEIARKVGIQEQFIEDVMVLADSSQRKDREVMLDKEKQRQKEIRDRLRVYTEKYYKEIGKPIPRANLLREAGGNYADNEFELDQMVKGGEIEEIRHQHAGRIARSYLVKALQNQSTTETHVPPKNMNEVHSKQ